MSESLKISGCIP